MVFITGDIHGDTTPVHDLFDKCQPTENDIIVLLGIDQSTIDNSTEHWLDTIEEMLDYKAWYLGH